MPYRAESGGIDFGIGLYYFDMVGRSVDTARSGDATIDSLTTRIASFSSLAGVSWHQLRSARTLSNNPEQLITRIEGYSVQLDFCFPIKANHKSRLVTSDQVTTARGTVLGYSLLLSSVIYLGF
jgi:hypothetical protein